MPKGDWVSREHNLIIAKEKLLKMEEFKCKRG